MTNEQTPSFEALREWFSVLGLHLPMPSPEMENPVLLFSGLHLLGTPIPVSDLYGGDPEQTTTQEEAGSGSGSIETTPTGTLLGTTGNAGLGSGWGRGFWRIVNTRGGTSRPFWPATKETYDTSTSESNDKINTFVPATQTMTISKIYYHWRSADNGPGDEAGGGDVSIRIAQPGQTEPEWDTITFTVPLAFEGTGTVEPNVVIPKGSGFCILMNEIGLFSGSAPLFRLTIRVDLS